jgi:5'-phosphate synthase pdxT subunit
LIIPGGESTTIGKLLSRYGILEEIKNFHLPIFGTCAGVVLLAKKIKNSEQVRLSLLDIEVERNAYGPQKFSFESFIKIEKLGIENYRGIFIRAPIIKKVGENVEVLAKLDENIVFVKEGNIIACTFHPELTDDLRIHQYFLEIVKGGV